MRPLDRRDFAAGAALLAVGAAFALAALQLRIGTARQMGAGYFPLIFAVITMALGLLLAVSAFGRAGRLKAPPWRPFLAVSAAILAFVATMPLFGLAPAVLTTVAVAALADRRSQPLGTLLLALGLAAGSWLIFVQGLAMPFRLLRWPF